MFRRTTWGLLFLAALVVILVLAASDLSHRNGAAAPALAAVQTSADGIYMIPNNRGVQSLDDYPLRLEQFLKEHADKNCVYVGDYVSGSWLQGHFFRCTCRVPDPCENGVVPAQELTTE